MYNCLVTSPTEYLSPNRNHFITSINGSALLEFALVLPVIVVFLSAIADFGWALDQSISLRDALRAGTRVAVSSRVADCIEVRQIAEKTALTYWQQAGGTDVSLRSTYQLVIDDYYGGNSYMLHLQARGVAACFFCALPFGLKNIEAEVSFHLEPISPPANIVDCDS